MPYTFAHFSKLLIVLSNLTIVETLATSQITSKYQNPIETLKKDYSNNVSKMEISRYPKFSFLEYMHMPFNIAVLLTKTF